MEFLSDAHLAPLLTQYNQNASQFLCEGGAYLVNWLNQVPVPLAAYSPTNYKICFDVLHNLAIAFVYGALYRKKAIGGFTLFVSLILAAAPGHYVRTLTSFHGTPAYGVSIYASVISLFMTLLFVMGLPALGPVQYGLGLLNNMATVLSLQKSAEVMAAAPQFSVMGTFVLVMFHAFGGSFVYTLVAYLSGFNTNPSISNITVFKTLIVVVYWLLIAYSETKLTANGMAFAVWICFGYLVVVQLLRSIISSYNSSKVQPLKKNQ